MRVSACRIDRGSPCALADIALRRLPRLGSGSHARRPSQQEKAMEYAPENLAPRERYKVLTSFVLPRPIAWVTSLGPTGVSTPPPFIFLNVFAEDPPLCMFAVNRRPDGRVKDTQLNIQR